MIVPLQVQPFAMTPDLPAGPVQAPPPPGDGSASASPHLVRRFGFWQATALNMSNMIGIGPFITIPALMSAINGGGPQCMLGWIVALLLAVPDGLTWAECGPAM